MVVFSLRAPFDAVPMLHFTVGSSIRGAAIVSVGVMRSCIQQAGVKSNGGLPTAQMTSFGISVFPL